MDRIFWPEILSKSALQFNFNLSRVQLRGECFVHVIKTEMMIEHFTEVCRDCVLILHEVNFSETSTCRNIFYTIAGVQCKLFNSCKLIAFRNEFRREIVDIIDVARSTNFPLASPRFPSLPLLRSL